jgi:hypothetical protein
MHRIGRVHDVDETLRGLKNPWLGLGLGLGLGLKLTVVMHNDERCLGTRRTRSLQDETRRAWNFYTALYYKAFGRPWRLPRNNAANHVPRWCEFFLHGGSRAPIKA